MWSKCSSQHHRYRGQRQREKVFRAQGEWFGEGPCLLGVPLVSLPGQSPSTELWQHCLDLFPSWASLRVSEDSLLGVKDPLLCELHTDNTIPLICMSRISASSPLGQGRVFPVSWLPWIQVLQVWGSSKFTLVLCRNFFFT